MKQKFISIIALAILHVVVLKGIESMSVGQDHFIYGKISTEDNHVYTGQIRWGKEEAFWFDFFNSTKIENENLKLLTKADRKKLEKKDGHRGNWSWLGIDGIKFNDNSDHSHSFACQFGDIKSLDINGRQKVLLTLKNGETINLKGGSNDIGAEVQIYDNEVGLLKLKWHKIETVEFMDSKVLSSSKFGAPLFGTVETEEGKSFTGFVQWDHDERLTNDELNGEIDDGKLDIEFGKIRSISKRFRGSEVELKSGRSLRLTGSNDVDNDNRGVIVNHPNFGRVDIPWDEFESVTFQDNPKKFDINYETFIGQKEISGTVETTNGSSYSGMLIYDLDESCELEMLNGIQNDIEYFIPFSVISEISPLDWSAAEVILINGEKYELEGKVDVNEDNDGVLVKNGRDDMKYIEWDEIRTIKLNH